MPEVSDPVLGKRRIGRPTLKNDRVCNLICARLASGKSLTQIVKGKHMPRYSTVMEWVQDDAEFADKFRRARDCQAEYFADQIIEIAETAQDRDSSAAARVKIEARLRRAQHLKPKTFSDRPGPAVTITNTVVVAGPEKLQEMREKLARVEQSIPLLQDA